VSGLSIAVAVGFSFVNVPGHGSHRLSPTTINQLFGYYEGGTLIYAGRTRNGFTPTLRQDLMKRFQPLKAAACPLANLPEKKSGRWGCRLTPKKMVGCPWLKPCASGSSNSLNGPGRTICGTRG
jgi:hypothetical protein